MMEITWVVGACLSTLLVILLTSWIFGGRQGALPPGSLGLPLIGEILELMIPSYSLDLIPFLKKRIQRFGKIFKTRVAGRVIVVLSDTTLCRYVFQQDGKLFEPRSLDTFSKVFAQEATNVSDVHRYVRSLVLKHFGMEALKQKLLNQLEVEFRAAIRSWSQQESVDIKYASGTMALEFGAKKLFSYDPKQSSLKLGEVYFSLTKGLMAIPLNIPGTTHYKCLQNRKKAMSMIREIFKKRRASPEKRPQEELDLLDHLIADMESDKSFLTEELAVQLLFNLPFVSFDSVSTTLCLTLKFLAEHPRALQELIDEHEAIRKNREGSESPITWEEYKSMSFTIHLINEVLRLGNISPGLFRRTKTVVDMNGYKIPAGWGIMIATSALHMDPEIYEDPTTFNPWRWKDCKSEAMVKNLMPFGWGMKQCAGAEYSRVFLATFLHVLVTGYRWKVLKGGQVCRSPMLSLGQGMHIKFMQKDI
ncbi:hypothetical protein SAY86_007189 [Trapa natans]|uniref:Uncharacterized protein n=1 Tax=Trapa natans TaxID=22666 RepID=A0AAN7QWM4_TRANT|nr:hypothetical protein SAY86_007048 [Trapa natans]KAK4782815.1 hypothetical protein SAY86_007189 [Trapa natans]